MVKVVNIQRNFLFIIMCRDSAQVNLKHKLKCLQGEYKSVGAALEIQCRENIKVSMLKMYPKCPHLGTLCQCS